MRTYGTMPAPVLSEEEKVARRIAANLKAAEDKAEGRKALFILTALAILWAVVSTLEFLQV